MAYKGFKGLPRGAPFDKVLRDKIFTINKNPKYNGYQRGITSMVYNFLIKRLLVMLLKVKLF